jgi:hypothetical protein
MEGVRSPCPIISNKGAYTRHGQRKTEGTDRGVKLIWPQSAHFCPQSGIFPVKKNQIRFLSINLNFKKMKRKMFLLSALVLMVAGGIFWSCQKDEFVTNSGEGLMLKAAPLKPTPILTLLYDPTPAEVSENVVIKAEVSYNNMPLTCGQVQLFRAVDADGNPCSVANVVKWDNVWGQPKDAPGGTYTTSYSAAGLYGFRAQYESSGSGCVYANLTGEAAVTMDIPLLPLPVSIGYQSAMPQSEAGLYEDYGVFSDAVFLSSSQLGVNAWGALNFDATVSWSQIQIDNHVAKYTANIPTSYSGTIVLDIEFWLHPKDWHLYNDDPIKRDQLFTAIKRRIQAVDTRFPQARLVLYGVPTFIANPGDSDKLTTDRKQSYILASQAGVYDRLNGLGALCYFRNGDADYDWNTLVARVRNYFEYSINFGSSLKKSDGTDLNVDVLMSFACYNGASQSNNKAISIDLQRVAIEKINDLYSDVNNIIYWAGEIKEKNNDKVWVLDKYGIDPASYFDEIF